MRHIGYIHVGVDTPAQLLLSVSVSDLLQKQRCILFKGGKYYVYELILKDCNKFALRMFSQGTAPREKKLSPHLRSKTIELVKKFNATVAEEVKI